MKPLKRTITTVILAAILGAIATASLAQPAGASRPESACRSEEAVGLPNWLVEGVWDQDKLVFVDSSEKRLAQVSNTGISLDKRNQTALVQYLAPFRPVGIRKGTLSPGGAGQVFVELARGGLIPLDRNFSPRPRLALATDELSKGADRTKQSYLFDWILVNGKIVGYGDIEGPGTSQFRWKNGFVRYSLNDPTRFEVARERPHGEGVRAAFRLAYPFLAGIGGTAYAIVIDGAEMGLWKWQPGDKDLVAISAFPKHLDGKPAPALWDWAREEEFPLLMEQIEQAAMPTGLYAWEGFLFLVSRTFEQGKHNWYLSKIDPVNDRLVWTAPIPTTGTARHMTVVPGAAEWAFLEKGPVTGYMQQTTHHIQFIQSARMRAQRLSSLCR